MNKEEKQFLIRVDEILFYLWDPIGVRDVPEARDEYSSYVNGAAKLAKSSSPPQAIADYLNKIESERMGISARNEHSLVIANLLLETKDAIFD